MRDTDEVRVQAVAIALFDEASAAQRKGDLKRAFNLYSRSIAVFPTAEALTYRGWVRSFFGQFDEAIEDCRRAIEIDAEFGSPYNDIGAYLIELGRGEEAVGWLEQAIRAPRYEPRCYPYFNLARIYMSKEQLRRALQHVELSLRLQPDFQAALELAELLQLRLN